MDTLVQNYQMYTHEARERMMLFFTGLPKKERPSRTKAIIFPWKVCTYYPAVLYFNRTRVFTSYPHLSAILTPHRSSCMLYNVVNSMKLLHGRLMGYRSVLTILLHLNKRSFQFCSNLPSSKVSVGNFQDGDSGRST